MAILMDLNQVVISNLMMSIKMSRLPSGFTLEPGMFRHMILNSIRMNRKKFVSDYGELIICCDDTNNWRKDIFPCYKATRKRDRDDSLVDWSLVFNTLNDIKQELREFFPYKVVQVPRAEADDVIGAIVHYRLGFGMPIGGERALILSGDKDFQQLQTYPNIEQYDPVRKRSLRCPNPKKFLVEHILRGDRGDGIPNYLSDDDSLINPNKRQKKVYDQKIQPLIETYGSDDYSEWTNVEENTNFVRNDQLINLQNIPQDIVDQILHEYDEASTGDRSKLFNYMIKYNLKQLTESIGDF